MIKNWNIKSESLNTDGGNLLDTLLEIRGVDKKERDEFLNPLSAEFSSPYVFSDMKKAKDRIETAVKNKELILVWGDFDADGVTSTSILHKTLTALGANFDCKIPDREKMGHGLNTKFLLPYIAKHKPKVLITVDCGISNNKEVSLIKNFGIDIIITDHHKAPDILPEAYAIINPKAGDSLENNLSVPEIKKISELAGAGVAFKLASALLENVNDEKLKNEILVLACVGTIADVVPLLYENRTIAAKGINLINKGEHKGLSQLFKTNSKAETITSYDIAFILAPRINAAGRLATAECAFKLLTSEDDTVLKEVIKELDSYNKIRQNLCDKIFAEALDMIDKDKNFKKQKALILFNEDWHLGVTGIVASKLVEKYYKPVFIVTKDDDNMARCSIRGIKEYNITEILDENAALFDGGYGGHSLAGGFSFDLGQTSFETVKNKILETFNSLEDVKITGPVLDIDMVIEAKDVNEKLLEASKMLEPTGQNNPAPVFAIKDAGLISKKTMGKENNHISFRCKKDDTSLSCVWWKHPDIPVIEGGKLDIAFEAKLNSFNGETSIRLYIEDIKAEHDVSGQKTGELKFYDHRMKNGILANIEEYVKRPNIDIDVYAKKIKTRTLLKDYPGITSKIAEDNFTSDDIMFFDYPPNAEEFLKLLKGRSGRVHLMAEEFDENIENCIKQLIGMLKYASNNKNGEISAESLASLIGVNEVFIQIALEILEDFGSIQTLDYGRIKFIAPPGLEKFFSHSEFEHLNEEFQKVIEFKKYIARALPDDIEKLLFDVFV